jgi:hypothetical protein
VPLLKVHLRSDHEARTELVREATIMILYVSVVEIAELAALPERRLPSGRVTGAVGTELVAILWGTATGLALAHWFAFRIAAPAFRGGRPTSHDNLIGLAQLVGAMMVAAVSSVPALLVSGVWAQEVAGDVPAVLVGVVAYLIARHAGSSRLISACYGAAALALAVLVAVVKVVLAGH